MTGKLMTRGCRTRLLVASSPETQHRSPPLPSLDFFLHRPRLSLDPSRHSSLSFSMPSKTSDHYNSGPLTLGFKTKESKLPIFPLTCRRSLVQKSAFRPFCRSMAAFKAANVFNRLEWEVCDVSQVYVSDNDDDSWRSMWQLALVVRLVLSRRSMKPSGLYVWAARREPGSTILIVDWSKACCSFKTISQSL